MLTAQQFEAIAASMGRPSTFGTRIDAGYTYLGQFIAHDIVPETRPTPGRGRNVTPHLNLDSLYGSASHPVARPDRRGLFPVGPSIPNGPDDLPRDAGMALIPELRNDENVIVAQLHRFWMQLHNFTITERYASDVEDARRMITLVFQLVVVEDYLRLILNPQVFDHHFRRRRPPLLGFPSGVIPPEFSRASFRFGHPMVRQSYLLRAGAPEVEVRRLFQAGENLERELNIDWSVMFGWPHEGRAQRAMAICPFIHPGMTSIPVPGRPDVNIIKANLEAGEHARLHSGALHVQKFLSGPNGRVLREQFHLTGLTSLRPLGNDSLSRAGVDIDNLPLWPYVLLEAEQQTGGDGLGVLGSLICADVLARSIAGSEHSIFKITPGDVDGVLKAIGAFGDRINDIRQQHTRAFPRQRELCMRHLIEVLKT